MTLKIFYEPLDQTITETYYWNNRSLLQGWIQFYTTQVAFGGLVQKRTVRDLLIGYEDPFLKDIKTEDLMRGGDPSIDIIILLNEANQTLEESLRYRSKMYSGYSDPYLTRNFLIKDGSQHIYFTKNTFDGYDIKKEQLSPYKKWVNIKGTDGMQNRPLSNRD